MKKHAPATDRNREAIAQVLRSELPKPSTGPKIEPEIELAIVLEVASGSGEHAVFFAGQFPQLEWLPSDQDEPSLASITAYRDEYAGSNLRAPIMLDAAATDWPVERADAAVCINMVHISPWAATEGLFQGAARLLDADAPLILYGPFLDPDRETATSNLEFDRWLKAKNPHWGIRSIAQIDPLAQSHGFSRSNSYEMPANNLMLIYRRN
ncbi:MAG: DUF938 domain-containing protein [Erythrobacter sp.]